MPTSAIFRGFVVFFLIPALPDSPTMRSPPLVPQLHGGTEGLLSVQGASAFLVTPLHTMGHVGCGFFFKALV